VRRAYRIARDLGHAEPGVLMRQLTPRQWRRLTYSYAYDPPAHWQTPRLLAMLIAATYNASMNRGKETPWLEAEDFLPDYDGLRVAATGDDDTPAPDVDPSEFAAAIMGVFATAGVEVRDERHGASVDVAEE